MTVDDKDALLILAKPLLYEEVTSQEQEQLREWYTAQSAVARARHVAEGRPCWCWKRNGGRKHSMEADCLGGFLWNTR